MKLLFSTYAILSFTTFVGWIANNHVLLAMEVSDCSRAQKMIGDVINTPPSKEKIRTISDAVLLCPESEKYHFLLGTSIERYERTQKKPKLESAGQAYAKAIELNPQYANAYFQLAGIHYLYGRFPKANESYSKFLELVDTTDTELRKKAEEMIVKCLWLQTLPEGSVKFAILHQDYGRFDATMLFIADIGLELGNAAFNATGNLSYLGGGIGVASIAMLAAAGGKANFSGFQKAMKNNDNAKLYEIYKRNLPFVINEEGINSESVQTYLHNIFAFGHDIINSEELFPFTNAVVHYADNPNPEYKEFPENTVLMARIMLGYYYFDSRNYPLALKYCRSAKDYYSRLDIYNEFFPRNIALEFRIIASGVHVTKGTPVNELNGVFSLFEKVDRTDTDDSKWIRSYKVQLAWLLENIVNKVNEETSIHHYLAFEEHTTPLRSENTVLTETNAIILASYASYLTKWAEYMQANEIIELLEARYTLPLATDARFALAISNIYRILKNKEKSDSIFSSNPILNSHRAIKWKRLYTNGLISIDSNDIDTARYFWNEMLLFSNENPDFSISSIVPRFALWVVDEYSPIYLDTLLFSLELELGKNFDQAFKDLRYIIEILVKFNKSNPSARYAHSQLERLVNDIESEKASDLMYFFRYNWFVRNKEYDKALRLAVSSERNNAPIVQAQNLEDVLVLNAKKKAFLLFKLGRYEESLEVLESSYASIVSFRDNFPDKELFLKAKKVRIFEALGDMNQADIYSKEIESVDPIIWEFVNFR